MASPRQEWSGRLSREGYPALRSQLQFGCLDILELICMRRCETLILECRSDGVGRPWCSSVKRLVGAVGEGGFRHCAESHAPETFAKTVTVGKIMAE